MNAAEPATEPTYRQKARDVIGEEVTYTTKKGVVTSGVVEDVQVKRDGFRDPWSGVRIHCVRYKIKPPHGRRIWTQYMPLCDDVEIDDENE